MTLTIDLSMQEEARLAAASHQNGLSPEMLAKKLVTEHLPFVVEAPPDREASRIAAIHNIRGSMSQIGTNVEALHHERQTDKQQEEQIAGLSQ